MAYDSANPVQKATALVTIAVTRNENEPRFGQNRFTVPLVETAALGTSIQQVEANDADGVRKLLDSNYHLFNCPKNTPLVIEKKMIMFESNSLQ